MIPCFGTQIFAGMTENKTFKINHYKKVLAVWGQLQLKKKHYILSKYVLRLYDGVLINQDTINIFYI